jgi:FMN phosphatase YigB (HAD superfamily)
MLRALTFDYWDTLYEGGRLPGRVALRRTAVGALLGAYGRDLPEEQLQALYEESGREAERWWSEEQRGYKTDDRLRWILEHAALKPRDGCQHVATAADAVDNALLMLPPAMLAGAWQMLRSLQRRFTLAVISDTGFASGRAQDRLLEKDAARKFFASTIYSMDIGHAKPRPEIFQAAVDALAFLLARCSTSVTMNARMSEVPSQRDFVRSGWTSCETAARARRSSSHGHSKSSHSICRRWLRPRATSPSVV